MSLPAHFPELKVIPADFKLALASEIIALGYVEVENLDPKAEKEFKLVGSTLLLKSIADTFEIDLLDELKFFTPSGKAGESFELPISAPDAKAERLLLVGLGDQSIAALRAAGATVGRKVKGKAQSISTFCATTDTNATAHAISATMGAYLWNLKSGAKPLKPTISLSISTLALKRALAIAAAVWRARDMVHTQLATCCISWQRNYFRYWWLFDEAAIRHDDGDENRYGWRRRSSLRSECASGISTTCSCYSAINVC